MPVIAYQSFNSNASSTHGLQQTSFQRFTRDTNKYVTGEGHEALVLPFHTGSVTTPFEGPAQLKAIEPLTSAPKTNHVFGAQVALTWQNLYRALGAMPDIMVVGELDTSHADFSNMVSDPMVSVSAHPAKRACQSFSSFTQTSLASQISGICEGEGYVAYSVADLTVVFVHVPNRIATSRTGTQDFYLAIAYRLLSFHRKVIDLVIGDTNQSSFNFTKEVLNLAFHGAQYENASASAQVVKIDNYNVVEGGTNSTGTKMYDVAVYRSTVVDLKSPVAYISQSSNATTVTDHCGLGVLIEKKSS